MAQEIERRTFKFDVAIERRAGKSPELVGHAAVFDEWTDIGEWFREIIRPGAFKDSIGQDDVRALFNHDPNFVLGRNVAETLFLEEDDQGLFIRIVPSESQLVRDLVMIPIQRGDISQMSFGFQTLEDKWIRGKEDEPDKRELLKVRLFDVSPVTFPAYAGTDVAVRSHQSWVKCSEKKSGLFDVRARRLKLRRRYIKE